MVPLSPAESGFFNMKDYDVTKLPFISISREGAKMLKKLDEETLYNVMQNVLDYVLTGEKCDCTDTLSNVVCGMLIDVIDRKGQKAFNSIKNLPSSPKSKEETKQVEVKQEPQPAPEPPKENKYKNMPWEEYLKLFINRHPSFNYDMNVDNFVSTYVETLEQFQKFVYENYYTVEKFPLATLAFEILYYKEQGKVYKNN